MKNKKHFSDKLVRRIKEIARQSLKKNHLNKTMSAIAYVSKYLYEYNQYYMDEDLEEFSRRIGQEIRKKEKNGIYLNEESSNAILVYDGFGLDIRGTIKVYLNGLGHNNYKVVYVTNYDAKGKIPSVEALCNKFGFEIEYIRMNKYLEWVEQIYDIYEKYKPRAAFIYTTPWDVAGVVAFSMYEGIVDRYLIDLTDHAFWLGKSAFDYCLGSREMSATIEHYYRDIPKEKLVKLDVNLLIDEDDDHTGLPFAPEQTRYIFSGGSLYKTLGDGELLYYKIVDHILEKHKDICFLYAGSGDDNEMKKLQHRYPGRAFLISEREDFYYLIQNSVFYLNTYPMFGGMMMRYAAMAKKIPITLRHNNDADGLLINQANSKIEYDDIKSLLEDVDKLLTDSEYLKKREELLEGTVITQERFTKNIKSIIEEHKSDEEHIFVNMDTSEFRQEYITRFNCRKELISVSSRINSSLFLHFPIYFALRGMRSVYKRIRRIIKK